MLAKTFFLRGSHELMNEPHATRYKRLFETHVSNSSEDGRWFGGKQKHKAGPA
uniref:Uncharacterized protein n=1 Tax=Amphimedon queenslandica TaxID=400682 RepID=A0A1X7VHG6_AMPQE